MLTHTKKNYNNYIWEKMVGYILYFMGQVLGHPVCLWTLTLMYVLLHVIALCFKSQVSKYLTNLGVDNFLTLTFWTIVLFYFVKPLAYLQKLTEVCFHQDGVLLSHYYSLHGVSTSSYWFLNHKHHTCNQCYRWKHFIMRYQELN